VAVGQVNFVLALFYVDHIVLSMKLGWSNNTHFTFFVLLGLVQKSSHKVEERAAKRRRAPFGVPSYPSRGVFDYAETTTVAAIVFASVPRHCPARVGIATDDAIVCS